MHRANSVIGSFSLFSFFAILCGSCTQHQHKRCLLSMNDKDRNVKFLKHFQKLSFLSVVNIGQVGTTLVTWPLYAHARWFGALR